MDRSARRECPAIAAHCKTTPKSMIQDALFRSRDAPAGSPPRTSSGACAGFCRAPGSNPWVMERMPGRPLLEVPKWDIATLAYYEAARCMRGLVRVAEARLSSVDHSAPLIPLDASSFGERLATFGARTARFSGEHVCQGPVALKSEDGLLPRLDVSPQRGCVLGTNRDPCADETEVSRMPRDIRQARKNLIREATKPPQGCHPRWVAPRSAPLARTQGISNPRRALKAAPDAAFPILLPFLPHFGGAA
jgi:hypothetical protein